LLSLEDVNAVDAKDAETKEKAVNNPEQVPTSQVGEVNIGNEDHREVDVTMDNENNPEQVPTSQAVGAINMNEVYGDVDMTLNEEDGNVVSMVNEDNPEQGLPSPVVETPT
jgi:hypothetical protein